MKGKDVIVLALPRGGLPVATEVAEELKAPLDVLVVRKVGVPWQPELAMGAVAKGTRVLDHSLIRGLRIPEGELEAVIAREEREVQRREKLFRGDAPPPDLEGKTVLIVDDGLATGSTMAAAVKCVRASKPAKVVVAVPVGSSDASEWLGREADECICLETPVPFSSVGQWYEDFRQVSDEEVIRTMRGKTTGPKA